MENADDPNSNTYCIVGSIDKTDYLFDEGKYWFRLIYGYSDGSNVTIEWTQESWLTESTITGFDGYGVPNQNGAQTGSTFLGLGLCSTTSAYLDGDAYSSGSWWNAVGATTAHGGGIPAFNETIAKSSWLYVRIPGIL